MHLKTMVEMSLSKFVCFTSDPLAKTEQGPPQHNVKPKLGKKVSQGKKIG
jgi:hypothetical protein